MEEIFSKEGVARKQQSQLFNRSIFDALAFYASRPDIRSAMAKNAQGVKAAYTKTIANPEFQEAIESDTAGIPHTYARLRIWGEALARALKMDLPIPRLEENDRGEMRLFS